MKFSRRIRKRRHGSSRFAKRAVSRMRRTRRPRVVKPRFRRRVRRFASKRRHGRGKSVAAKRARLLSAITPPRVYATQIGDIWQATANVLTELPILYAGSTSQNPQTSSIVANSNSTYCINHIWNIALAMPIPAASNQSNNAIGNLTTGLNDRFIVTKAIMTHRMNNVTNVPCFVDMYYCICRKELPNLASNIIFTSVLSEGFAANGHPTVALTTDPMQKDELTPFQSTTFCEYFKIYKVRKMTLMPGRTRTVSISSRKPKWFNMSNYLNQTSQTETYLTTTRTVSWVRGSKFILFKLKGDIISNPDTPTTNVTGAVCKVDVVTNNRLTYKVVSPNKTIIGYSVPQKILYPAITNPTVMTAGYNLPVGFTAA